MSTSPPSDYELLKGRVSGLVSHEGIIEFRVGNRRLTMIASADSSVLRHGEAVELVVAPSLIDGACEVIAFRRAHGKPVYVGPRMKAPVTLLGAALMALGLHKQLPWLVVAPTPLLILQWLFTSHRARALSAFRAVRRSLGSPSAAEDVPLSISLQWPTQLLEFTHDAIIIWEMDGAGILYWNRAAERLYGFSREQARGRVTHELLRTQTAGGIGELETRLARFGIWIGDLRHTRSDGRVVEVEARLSLMSQEHRPWLVLEVNRDVTDRNRAEADRAEMAAQLARLRGRNLVRPDR